MSNQIIARPQYTLAELVNISRSVAQSQFFPDLNPNKALVSILAGQELGIGPIASVTGIHVIKGKPVMGANLMAGRVQADPRFTYRVEEHTNEVCRIVYYEIIGNSTVKLGESTFTMKEARDAGLAGKDNWRKYPRNMLFARAMSNGVRWFCPAVFGGAPVYTPDEFDVAVDEDGDAIIEGEAYDPTPEDIIESLGFPAGAEVTEVEQEPEVQESPPERPYEPVYAKDRLNQFAAMFADGRQALPSDKALNMVAKNLTDLFVGVPAEAADENRRVLTDYVFGERSTKNLTLFQRAALYKWMGYRKDDMSSDWLPNPMSEKEAVAMVNQHLKDSGQIEMPMPQPVMGVVERAAELAGVDVDVLRNWVGRTAYLQSETNHNLLVAFAQKVLAEYDGSTPASLDEAIVLAEQAVQYIRQGMQVGLGVE